MSRLRRIREEEGGFSLIELLVAMLMSTIILLGTFAIVQAATRSSNRTASRVVVNQDARPVLTRIITELNSSLHQPRPRADPGRQHRHVDDLHLLE